MDLFVQLPYWLKALFAALRIAFWFILLFGFIAPLFLRHTRTLPTIERMIYSWVGLGGVILFSIFILSTLHIYDFISITLTLLLIPVFLTVSRSNSNSIADFFKQWELQTLVKHLRVIENGNSSVWKWITSVLPSKKTFSLKESGKGAVVLGIALTGGLIRIYPALLNAAPFSRGWFTHLNRIKNIRLQDYFSGYPEPAGMHSLVSLFSMLTQVSPELILHLLGAISSFFLCIIISWAAKDITKNRYPMAAVAGMAVYALAPMLFMPISLDQQVEPSSLDLALCFALPTITIFVRNLRNSYKSPWFYILSGFIATALVDLFVAFIILLPLMLLGLSTLPRRNYFRSFAKVFGYLLWISFLIIVPIFSICYVYDIEIQSFLLTQLYSVQAYSYYPSLILPISELSSVYILIASVTSLFYLIQWLVKKGRIRDELIFLGVFLLSSLPYTDFLEISNYIWLDIDQLNGFYAVLTAVFISILCSTLLEWIHLVFKLGQKGIQRSTWTIVVLVISSALFLQGGIKVSPTNPDTVPNGFLEAYYKIIDDRLPYSYATVGPEIQRIMAMNRNYFMDYTYFLDEYSAIDSLYQQQLKLPKVEQAANQVLPASVFIFTVKSPYTAIQQGIQYDAASVMKDLEQWVESYKEYPNRKIEVFYSDNNTVVYEIINRQKESKIDDILYQVYPKKNSRYFIND